MAILNFNHAPDPVPLDDGREELRAAIAKSAAMAAEREQLEAALARAGKMVSKAEDDLGKARDTAEKAQDRARGSLLAALKAGRDIQGDKGVAGAKARLSEAESSLEIAQQAQEALQLELAQLNSEGADAEVRAAVRRVMCPLVATVLAGAATRLDGLRRDISTLNWFVRELTQDEASNRIIVEGEVRESIDRFKEGLVDEILVAIEDNGAVIAPLAEAFAALHRDPDAALPEV